MQIAGSGLRHNANNEIQKVPLQNVFVFLKLLYYRGKELDIGN